MNNIVFTAIAYTDAGEEALPVTQRTLDDMANVARNAIAADHSVVKSALGEWSSSGTGHGPVPIEGLGRVEWDPILHEVTVDGLTLPAETAAELLAIGLWVSANYRQS